MKWFKITNLLSIFPIFAVCVTNIFVPFNCKQRFQICTTWIAYGTRMQPSCKSPCTHLCRCNMVMLDSRLKITKHKALLMKNIQKWSTIMVYHQRICHKNWWCPIHNVTFGMFVHLDDHILMFINTIAVTMSHKKYQRWKDIGIQPNLIMILANHTRNTQMIRMKSIVASANVG